MLLQLFIKCILDDEFFILMYTHYYIFAGDVDDASSTIDMLNIVSDRFNNYQKFFHFREIILPHNKSFTSLETRLETFVKCIKLKQNIRTFCEAGLYYIGIFIILFSQIKLIIL